MLIMDDPDAPGRTFLHWLLYGLPVGVSSLPEGVPQTPVLEALGGARQGRTDFGKVGYGGPCPPRGRPHRYFFRLYALDAELDLSPGASRAEVEAAMRGHVLGEGELMGTYGR